jgi:hypothetical protein
MASAVAIRPGDAAIEVRRLREEARSRYGEVDLLVAALRDHVRDLQAERDALRAELAVRDEATRRAGATWLWRGSKANRVVAGSR